MHLIYIKYCFLSFHQILQINSKSHMLLFATNNDAGLQSKFLKRKIVSKNPRKKAKRMMKQINQKKAQLLSAIRRLMILKLIDVFIQPFKSTFNYSENGISRSEDWRNKIKKKLRRKSSR